MAHEPDFEWHAIRPWTRRISLQIREVTSVSVTFILRSSMSASHGEALAALGSEFDEEEDATRRVPTISDALGGGLAVKINGNNWKRAVVHVDEDEEEAVVIVYGLLPRKKYDISLGVAAFDEPVQETVTTQPGQDEPTAIEMLAVPPNDHVVDSATSPSTLTPPTTPIRSSPPRMVTHEERATQLRKQLTLLNTEHEDLGLKLKSTRRESQRTETALKSEVETLKRASEKHASGEHRSRQKVLALQEAVKQTNAAAGDIEKVIREMEDAMPSLNARAEEAEAEYNTVKAEADRRSDKTEAALEVDRKLVAELQGELRGVCARLEKVTGKQEKLEKEVVPRLEEKLRELRNEIGMMEQAVSNTDEPKRVSEETYGPWSARNWVPPIQRPSTQRSSFSSTAGFGPTAPSIPLARRPSFRSPRTSNVKRSNVTLLPPLPSYDHNLLLRGQASSSSEETLESNGPSPRVTSDLKSGSTFHTPPRFQTQNASSATTSAFDFVVQRPSPNLTTGEHDHAPNVMSLYPLENNYVDSVNDEGHRNL